MSRVYGGRTSEERHAARRAQLLAAALEGFARDGWQGTTVAGVCRAASLSPRSFYEHFASLEELFAAVAEQIASEVAVVVREAVSRPDQGPDERARGVLAALAGYFAADPRRVRVGLVESLATPALRAHRARLLRSFAEPGARLMRALHPDPPRADAASLELSALVLSGGIVEALMAAADGEPAATTDALVEHLAQLYTAAVGLA